MHEREHYKWEQRGVENDVGLVKDGVLMYGAIVGRVVKSQVGAVSMVHS